MGDIMQLKNYQNMAIKKLLTRSKELLEQSGEKKIIFKAPTGSGKTIMVAEYLKQLIDDRKTTTPLAFIWTAPRKLHTQSKKKLEKYYEDSRALECSDFKNILSGYNLKTALADGTDIMVLEEALKKRVEIVETFREIGININPLLLIQLPDRKTQQEDRVKEEVVQFLKDKHGITTENGKLAIYLSEEKENLENIAKNDQETEVLIFKQAIALGWDCPRAQILVLFRDWKSLTFSVQTVGRIMRMPEPDTGHYPKEILNHGYVYTNLANIKINEDMARNYVTIYTSQRIEDYKEIKLESAYRLRQREKTRLAPLFSTIFIEEAKRYDLEKILETKEQKIETSFISDYEAESVDMLVKEEIKSELKLSLINI